MRKVNTADFESRWEYTKATSRWHFDPKRDEDAECPFKIVARFSGVDFSSIVKRALEINRPTTMANRLRNGQVPFTDRLERNDYATMGLTIDHVMYNESARSDFGERWPDELRKVFKWLGLQKRGFGCAIHVQYPGQTFPLHIDVFPSLKQNQEHHILDDHVDAAARFTLQLKDWEWGHMWSYGNTYWKQWEAGEISFHPWRDLPHATANSGFSPRVSVQITGLVTDRTRAILADARDPKAPPRIDLRDYVLNAEDI